MLCLWLFEPRKFNRVSLAMSEVTATGMETTTSRVCDEGTNGNVPLTHSLGHVMIPTWADTLLVNTQGFPRAKTVDEQEWKSTLFIVWPNNYSKKRLTGFLRYKKRVHEIKT